MNRTFLFNENITTEDTFLGDGDRLDPLSTRSKSGLTQLDLDQITITGVQNGFQGLQPLPSPSAPERSTAPIPLTGTPLGTAVDHLGVPVAAGFESNATSFFLSLQTAATLGGATFQNEDIVFFEGATQGFSTWFDGSDVGLGSLAIDAFDIISDTELLLSLTTPSTIAGIAVDDSDIVRFRANQLGTTTTGSFDLWLDGSDVGLTTDGEDIDGIQLLEDGTVLISTLGFAQVPGLPRTTDEDILQFDPSRLGNQSVGTWSIYLDGSDVGLGDSSSEDVGAIALDANDTLYLSTAGDFAVPGISGANEDVVVFNPNTTGPNTSGNFETPLFFDGSAAGLTDNIQGLDLAIGVGDLPGSTNPPPPPSPFNIEVNFIDNSLTASQRAVFADAASRWAEIIIADIPDVFVTGLGLVDDVVINASAPIIDGVGGTLGQAGPTQIRSGSFLPAAGVMQFDAADLANLEASDRLEDVILHEMGHVLGIGTIWSFFPDLLTGAGTSNPRFTGDQATAAYNSIFGLSDTSVPVENTGGAGTRDSHWRESVFNNELLTGFLDGGSNPISQITVGSLADLGYGVNLGAADPYSPPSSLVAGSTSAGLSTGAGAIGALVDPSDPLGDSSTHLHVLETEITFV